MKPRSTRRAYGTLALSRSQLRRLRLEWSVVESPLHPMRLARAVVASALAFCTRRAPLERAAA